MAMFTEARKIQLLEDVLKVHNEAILIELETVVNKSKKIKDKKAISAHDFSGLWSKKDAALIEKAITDSCEQIHEDDWK
jgi:3-dehydroquinate dehydratase